MLCTSFGYYMPSQGQSPRPSIVFLFFILLFLCPSCFQPSRLVIWEATKCRKGPDPIFSFSHEWEGRGYESFFNLFNYVYFFFSCRKKWRDHTRFERSVDYIENRDIIVSAPNTHVDVFFFFLYFWPRCGLSLTQVIIIGQLSDCHQVTFFFFKLFFLFVCFSSLAFMKRHLELLLTFLILFNIYVYSINFHSFLHLSSLTDDTLLGRVLCTLWLLSFQREREKRRGKVWERGSIRVAAPWAWREYLQ